jgi:protease I
MDELRNRRVLILVGPDHQDLELWYPRLRLREAGARVVVAGLSATTTYRGKHGYPCVPDAAIAEQRAGDYDGLVVPGGNAPRKLCRYPDVQALVRDFAASRKLIASICRGGLVPAAAGVYAGVRATSFPDVRDELERAGVLWEDAPLVIDRHFVSSRQPDDLPHFCQGILRVLTGSRGVA